MEVKDDNLLPLAKLLVYITDSCHGRGYIFNVLVNRVEVHDQSAVIFSELVKGFISSPSFSG